MSKPRVPSLCPLSDLDIEARRCDVNRRSLEFRLEDGTIYVCPSLCSNQEIAACNEINAIFPIRETRISLDAALQQLESES